MDTAIKTAFKNLDDRIMEHAKKTVKTHNPGSPEALSALAPAVAGTCALLAIYDPITSILRTAVTGDSRAVLGSWAADASTFTAEALSVDQNGFNEDEVARLCEAHPGRLFGMAITRAFGDHRWKYPREFLKHLRNQFFDTGPRPGYKTPPYMTAEPEITTRKVSTNDFVILASDGLWDHMSNEDAVECVSLWLAARRAGRADKGPKQQQAPAEVTVAREGFGSWRATLEHFVIEDLDNAAVCLAKNALGGNRRELFRGVMTEVAPRSRYVRDDVTVQVIFFEDPYQEAVKRP
jgi:pyruvate dehydrogenase phosphatase